MYHVYLEKGTMMTLNTVQCNNKSTVLGKMNSTPSLPFVLLGRGNLPLNFTPGRKVQKIL